MTWLGRVLGWVDARADGAIERRTRELWGDPRPPRRELVQVCSWPDGPLVCPVHSAGRTATLGDLTAAHRWRLAQHADGRDECGTCLSCDAQPLDPHGPSCPRYDPDAQAAQDAALARVRDRLVSIVEEEVLRRALEHRCVHSPSGGGVGHNCQCDLGRDHGRRYGCPWPVGVSA